MSRQAVVAHPIGTGQVVAIGAGSTPSTNPIGTNDQLGVIRGMRLVATVDCWYEVSQVPVAAATTSTFLPAFQVEYVEATAADKVAVIQATGAGSLYVRALL